MKKSTSPSDIIAEEAVTSERCCDFGNEEMDVTIWLRLLDILFLDEDPDKKIYS